ncbi:ProQ/FINO family protein [Thiofilum flexile]|uniref:ProQ/FINO family protein n=1 Tax=Thiofilum flexile TaxID=125627 RepID=UPI000DA1A338|nr:ProQ/FINO family protein [Thiofilum flexile]
MTDQPKKTLKIIRKVVPTPTTPIEPTEPDQLTPEQPIQRTGKRVLTKDKLQEVKPEKGTDFYRARKLPKPKPTDKDAKSVAKPARPKPPKKKVKPPSDIRAKELDASLNGFAMWRERKPLALNFERQVFQHVGKHHLSASKRVVMKLLEWHTANRFYLQAVSEGGKRFNLDGSEADTIQDYEISHALNKLAKRKK